MYVLEYDTFSWNTHSVPAPLKSIPLFLQDLTRHCDILPPWRSLRSPLLLHSGQLFSLTLHSSSCVRTSEHPYSQAPWYFSAWSKGSNPYVVQVLLSCPIIIGSFSKYPKLKKIVFCWSFSITLFCFSFLHNIHHYLHASVCIPLSQWGFLLTRTGMLPILFTGEAPWPRTCFAIINAEELLGEWILHVKVYTQFLTVYLQS